jgi:hypothetical protein
MARIEGPAERGSRLQMQIAVNRRSDELNQELLNAFPELRGRGAAITWRSPLAPDYRELRDGEFLQAVDLGHLAPQLREFWPLRGPVWDGLATVRFADGGRGVVLAEAKSHPEEFYAGGTKAKSDASLTLIRASIARTQEGLGIPVDVDRWLYPLRSTPSSSLYQSANRLAHLHFLRDIAGVEAWLVHVLFVEDRTHFPTSRSRWRQALTQIEHELGLRGVSVPFAGHVFLPGREPHELP